MFSLGDAGGQGTGNWGRAERKRLWNSKSRVLPVARFEASSSNGSGSESQFALPESQEQKAHAPVYKSASYYRL